MATDCYTQLGFGFQPKLVVDFAGGTLTTDAGLLLIREFDEQLRLSADVVSRIVDTRDSRYITHDLGALVRQRLYQIAAGYEDVNDADRLRHEDDAVVERPAGRRRREREVAAVRLLTDPHDGDRPIPVVRDGVMVGGPAAVQRLVHRHPDR